MVKTKVTQMAAPKVTAPPSLFLLLRCLLHIITSIYAKFESWHMIFGGAVNSEEAFHTDWCLEFDSLFHTCWRGCISEATAEWKLQECANARAESANARAESVNARGCVCLQMRECVNASLWMLEHANGRAESANVREESSNARPESANLNARACKCDSVNVRAC